MLSAVLGFIFIVALVLWEEYSEQSRLTNMARDCEAGRARS